MLLISACTSRNASESFLDDTSQGSVIDTAGSIEGVIRRVIALYGQEAFIDAANEVLPSVVAEIKSSYVDWGVRRHMLPIPANLGETVTVKQLQEIVAGILSDEELEVFVRDILSEEEFKQLFITNRTAEPKKNTADHASQAVRIQKEKHAREVAYRTELAYRITIDADIRNATQNALASLQAGDGASALGKAWWPHPRLLEATWNTLLARGAPLAPDRQIDVIAVRAELISTTTMWKVWSLRKLRREIDEDVRRFHNALVVGSLGRRPVYTCGVNTPYSAVSELEALWTREFEQAMSDANTQIAGLQVELANIPRQLSIAPVGSSSPAFSATPADGTLDHATARTTLKQQVHPSPSLCQYAVILWRKRAKVVINSKDVFYGNVSSPCGYWVSDALSTPFILEEYEEPDNEPSVVMLPNATQDLGCYLAQLQSTLVALNHWFSYKLPTQEIAKHRSIQWDMLGESTCAKPAMNASAPYR